MNSFRYYIFIRLRILPVPKIDLATINVFSRAPYAAFPALYPEVYPEIFSEFYANDDDDEGSTVVQKPAKVWIYRRNLIGALAFLGFFCAYMIRTNLSLAIVAMTNPDPKIPNSTVSIVRNFIFRDNFVSFLYEFFNKGRFRMEFERKRHSARSVFLRLPIHPSPRRLAQYQSRRGQGIRSRYIDIVGALYRYSKCRTFRSTRICYNTSRPRIRSGWFLKLSTVSKNFSKAFS